MLGRLPRREKPMTMLAVYGLSRMPGSTQHLYGRNSFSKSYFQSSARHEEAFLADSGAGIEGAIFCSFFPGSGIAEIIERFWSTVGEGDCGCLGGGGGAGVEETLSAASGDGGGDAAEAVVSGGCVEAGTSS